MIGARAVRVQCLHKHRGRARGASGVLHSHVGLRAENGGETAPGAASEAHGAGNQGESSTSGESRAGAVEKGHCGVTGRAGGERHAVRAPVACAPVCICHDAALGRGASGVGGAEKGDDYSLRVSSETGREEEKAGHEQKSFTERELAVFSRPRKTSRGLEACRPRAALPPCSAAC